MTSSPIICCRKIGFDSGHRVVNHESKCRTFHGHRYTAEIYACANQLDDLGRVIDFSVIKEKIGGWIDTYWDHTMIINKDDPDRGVIEDLSGYKEPFILDYNPTAENMALFLLHDVCPNLLADTNIEVVRIKLWETPNCFAEVSKPIISDPDINEDVVQVHEEI